MSEEALLVERLGDIVVLKLNRPDQGNSLNQKLIIGFKNQLKDALNGAKALVITGVGNRFFCTGADLKELADPNFDTGEMLTSFKDILDTLAETPVLTASFLNGDCLGGGLGIAFSTDYILACDDIRMGTPELKHGLFPYLISKPILERIGSSGAKALCFGAQMLPATEASQLGMASEWIGRDKFQLRCDELVELWNQSEISTLQNGKRVLENNNEISHGELIQFLNQAVADKKINMRRSD